MTPRNTRRDVPAAPQRRVAVEVQLLVLDAPAVDEVLILPDAIDHEVTREALQQRPRLPVGRVARIDVRMHDAARPMNPLAERKSSEMPANTLRNPQMRC